MLKKILSFSKKEKLGSTDKYSVKILQQARDKKYPSFKQIFHLHKVADKKELRILRVSYLLFVIGFGIFLFRFTADHRVSVPEVGGKFVEGVVGSPQMINPVLSWNEVDREIIPLVFTGLVRMGENNEMLPDLAESFGSNDEKTEYTFSLRKDVLWSDGEPFSARDVLFTFEMIQNDAYNSPHFSSFQGVSVEMIDDYTIKFTLKEAFDPFLKSLSLGILPEHIWSSVSPDRVAFTNANIQPVGTGPFKFSGIEKNSEGYLLSYTLVRNESFYREVPFIEEFTFQFFSEYDEAALALRESKIDALHFVPYELRDKLERKHIVLHTLNLPQYTALFFRLKHPLLEKDEIRNALAMALDTKRVMRSAVGDKGKVIESPILPGFPGYDENFEGIEYSLEKANEILDEDYERISVEDYKTLFVDGRLSEWEEEYKKTHPEPAGEENVSSTPYGAILETAKSEQKELLETEFSEMVSEGQTFYRKDKDGNVMSLRLVTADIEEYERIADSVISFWQELGIHIVFEVYPSRNIGKDIIKKRNYDILLYSVILGNDPDQYSFWHSSQVEAPGLNLSGFNNEDVDKLLDEIRKLPVEESASKYQELAGKLLEEKPAIFLYRPLYTYATTDRIQGIRFGNIYDPSDRFEFVSEWFLDTKGQWQF